MDLSSLAPLLRLDDAVDADRDRDLAVSRRRCVRTRLTGVCAGRLPVATHASARANCAETSYSKYFDGARRAQICCYLAILPVSPLTVALNACFPFDHAMQSESAHEEIAIASTRPV